jgi:hypothetical protein
MHRGSNNQEQQEDTLQERSPFFGPNGQAQEEGALQVSFNSMVG